MSDEDNKYGRKEPPEPHEWHDIWRSLERSDKGWIITGPIYAVVSNWKALVLIGSFLVWSNRPEILGFLSQIWGGSE